MNAPLPRGRVAVIGDVGGHLGELRRELTRLGASGDRLPPDLTIVQVGDLVHRGPDSAGVVALVDAYLRDQPGQWIQLVGNHEAQYLRPPAFEWPEQLPGPAADTIRRWWRDGLMRVAVAIGTEGEDFLITHAGLTWGFWSAVLASPASAGAAAAGLNALISSDPGGPFGGSGAGAVVGAAGAGADVLFSAGHLLIGRRPNPRAGPLWAVAGTELIPSWLGVRLPFSQVHGHTWIGGRRRLPTTTVRAVARLTVFDQDTRHETTTLDGGRIIGIDPGHGRHPRTPWRSLPLTPAPQNPSHQHPRE